MANRFTAAAAIPAVEKKAGKREKGERVATPGLLDYTMVCTLIDNLTAVKAAMAEPIKEQIVSYFKQQGARLMAPPDSYKGYEGAAEASLQLRRRASSSPLTEEQAAELRAACIEVGEEVVTPKQYVFNPAYMNDRALLEKISKALDGVKGVPDDLILLQEERKKYVVTEDTIATLFRKKAAVIDKFIETVMVPAIRTKLSKDVDIKKTLEHAKELVS